MYKLFHEYKEYVLLVILLIISLLFLSQNDHPNMRKLRTYAFGTFAYVNSALNSITDLLVDDDELIEAKKLNAKLMLQLNLLREYGINNFELKEKLGYLDRTEFPLVTAKVISRLTSRTEGNLILNKGKRDSIGVGMSVVSEDGLVGLVVEVSDDFSLVRTINNTAFKVTVTDQRSRVNGVLNWDGEKLLMKNVPTTYDVETGDRIVTSDLSVVFPPSIPVGIVVRKDVNISGLLGNVIVKPFAHPQRYSYLFIVKLIPSKQVEDLELNLYRSGN